MLEHEEDHKMHLYAYAMTLFMHGMVISNLLVYDKWSEPDFNDRMIRSAWWSVYAIVPWTLFAVSILLVALVVAFRSFNREHKKFMGSNPEN
jgi:uncharacterized membrane protein